MLVTDTPTAGQSGATYRFVVRTAEEAVRTIRERLGENARVLSVRQLPAKGLSSWWSKPKLEVIAQLPLPGVEATEKPQEAQPAVGSTVLRSSDPALPARFVDDSVAARGRGHDAVSALGSTAIRLPELLKKSGFSAGLMGRLATTPAMQGLEQKTLHMALAEVGRSLRQTVERRGAKPLPARTAFLGTAGVGRTTALCKWLAREVFANKKVVRVVKAEFDRPNPAEGLAVFCEALGVTMEHCTADQGPVAPGADPVYVDMPGLSLSSPGENKAMGAFLDREGFAGRVLVLNAAYDLSMMRRAYAIGRDLGATHLVFTHLDELEHWGKLWDVVIDGELTPLFLGTGPSLTGAYDENVVDGLMRKTLPGG